MTMSGGIEGLNNEDLQSVNNADTVKIDFLLSGDKDRKKTGLHRRNLTNYITRPMTTGKHGFRRVNFEQTDNYSKRRNLQ